MTAIRFEPSRQARGRSKTGRHHRRPRSGRSARMPPAARRRGLSADGRGRDNRAARSPAAGDHLKPDWRRSAEGTDTGTGVALATISIAGSRAPFAKELAAFLAPPPGPSRKTDNAEGPPHERRAFAPNVPHTSDGRQHRLHWWFRLRGAYGSAIPPRRRPSPAAARQSSKPYTPRQWVHEDAEGRGGLWTAWGGA